jgi:hypothetical protein
MLKLSKSEVKANPVVEKSVEIALLSAKKFKRFMCNNGVLFATLNITALFSVDCGRGRCFSWQRAQFHTHCL